MVSAIEPRPNEIHLQVGISIIHHQVLCACYNIDLCGNCNFVLVLFQSQNVDWEICNPGTPTVRRDWLLYLSPPRKWRFLLQRNHLAIENNWNKKKHNGKGTMAKEIYQYTIVFSC